eukprot:gnl/TRDRNA2_/TRDRNA2_136257_c0_seq1.p1 gnl/TRDRNA2_/TRDRNA2_136257_c0~~gnl/TRDRNA2_/TRDRNA2_136257_c0_seq1.p1  ORF type:complete len:442 (-),score=46.46 gnl/TRDRNA2_/TRDRNA2_136257_c0_seq1:115-1440(-)
MVPVYLLSTLLVLLFDGGVAERYLRFRGTYAKQVTPAEPAADSDVHQEPANSIAVADVEETNNLVALSDFDKTNALDPLNPNALRPHQGDEADVVEFGVYVKEFYGMDIKKSTWSADLILTLSWLDPRTIRLVPAGHFQVTMNEKTARKNIWMPDMIISNHAQNGVEPISTSFIVTKNGTVTRVSRVSAELQSRFHLGAFPFDQQTLRVTLASGSLMLDDLKLAPTNNTKAFGIEESSFHGKDVSLKSYELIEREETTSLLEKSRGDLRIVVQRNAAPYLMGILLPVVFMVIISWTVFWLPLIAPFAMPRVATALIAFLTLMTLSLRTDAMLPLRGDVSWLDLVESNCSGLMFYNVVFNVCCLVLYHQFDEKKTCGDNRSGDDRHICCYGTGPGRPLPLCDTWRGASHCGTCLHGASQSLRLRICWALYLSSPQSSKRALV